VGQNPTALAVDVHTRRVFVVNQGPLYRNGAGTAWGYGSVSMLDATTGTLLRTTRVGQNPRAVAIDERTGRVFVADGCCAASCWESARSLWPSMHQATICLSPIVVRIR
jgi:DNA-binding beta-propeller fold protein YncE